MKRKRYNFPFKLFFPLILIFLAIFLLIGYIWKVLTTSDFFSVKQVVVRNFDINLDYLKGRNIFNLDLDQQSRRVFLACPDCRKVRFSRVLPNTVVVDFLKRQPVALVKFYKNFAVDEEGVFFYSLETGEENRLPIIYGLETKIFAPKPGVKYKRAELDLALDIIREVRDNKSLKGFELKRIDAQNIESAGFFILMPKPAAGYIIPLKQEGELGFEVRIGRGNIKQKIMILGGLIIQARKDWGNIKYIDLRFKEPLIKLNNKL
ncbi:MAG: hypothetical protein PHY35_01405 [Candidatus Omnitrophica bacterium]|nr:hypothetical protein [Candidatus Omnitrophota bacterium]